jgi:serine/threonine protein kinase
MLENFLLGQALGAGAYATVKLGTNTETSEKVAIKQYEKYKLYDL